jgi:proteasome lid subunit RPN8/RPN11
MTIDVDDKIEGKYTFGYKIVMSRKFKDTIDWMSSNYDKEIGGFIIGSVDGDKLLLDDLIFPEQEADKGGIDFSTQQIAQLMHDYPEECNRIMGEWHSHNTMGCFWSGVDEGLINDFSEHRKLTVYIVSSKCRHLIRVEYRDAYLKFTFDKLGFCIANPDIENEMKQIIDVKVKSPSMNASKKQVDIFGNRSKDNVNFLQYGRNVIMLNNTVKVFGLHKKLRRELMEKFAEYNPERVERTCLLFSFETKAFTEQFFNIVRDYIYLFDSNRGGYDEWRDEEDADKDFQNVEEWINSEELQER